MVRGTIPTFKLENESIKVKSTIKFIILFLMATSCTTSRVAIDVLVEAENPVKSKGVSYGIIDKVDYDKAMTKQFFNGEFIESHHEINKALGAKAIQAVTSRVNEEGFISIVEVKPGVVPANGDFNGPVIQPKLVKDICKAYRVDGLIALEGFDAEVDAEQQIAYSPMVDRLYGTVRVPVIDGLHSAKMILFFRVYDANGQLVQIAQEEAQVQSTASASNPWDLARRLPRETSALERVAWKNGVMYGESISPHYERTTRLFYKYGQIDLEIAAKHIMENNWTAASAIWHAMTTLDKKSLAGRACFNMALASEVAGDLELALKWIKLAETEYTIKHALGYRIKLEQRIKEMESLKIKYKYADPIGVPSFPK